MKDLKTNLQKFQNKKIQIKVKFKKIKYWLINTYKKLKYYKLILRSKNR